jgi:hypothetical protein
MEGVCICIYIYIYIYIISLRRIFINIAPITRAIIIIINLILISLFVLQLFFLITLITSTMMSHLDSAVNYMTSH